MCFSSPIETACVCDPVPTDSLTHSVHACRLEDAFRSASSPAQNLELPTGALTYAKSDPKHIVQRFSEYGVRFLTQDEVADELPLYPKPFSPNASK